MHATRLSATAGLAFLACFAAASAKADPQTGIVILGGSGQSAVLTASALAQLPVTQVSVSFKTEHGERHGSFEGPLLWTVLDHAGAIDTRAPRDQLRQTVTVTGRDGYTAVLALAEIAPDFEGKQVILAERMDGHSLDPGHFRIVVPGDRYGGRSVRDVTRVAVTVAENRSN